MLHPKCNLKMTEFLISIYENILKTYQIVNMKTWILNFTNVHATNMMSTNCYTNCIRRRVQSVL
jgi:hypothetical protein